MASVLQQTSYGYSHRIGRLLYTSNPFYLISCFLILYGLRIAAPQIATLIGGGSFFASMLLLGAMAAYTMMMAAIAISVVRCCRVWDDARSIILVVIISLVALSTGLDQFCVSSLRWSGPLLGIGTLFALVMAEIVLHGCRMRLPVWYRLSMYGILAVFFTAPIGLGYAVRNRHDAIANWGAPLFSVLIAATLLLMMPAIRRGREYVTNNGTPWQWPLYPLSVFAVLVVLAVIRSHAIWMSFGFNGGPVRFEPFLLLPLAWAGLILFIAADRRLASWQTYAAMFVAPSLIVSGMSNEGMTHLPIRADILNGFGSAHTIAMIAISGVYFYAWLCRAKGAPLAFALTVALIPWVGELSDGARGVGIDHWMFAGLATGCIVFHAIRHRRSELNWIVVSVFASSTVLMAGQSHDQLPYAAIVSTVVSTLSMLLIGYYFDSSLATMLRKLAAIVILLTTVCLSLWQLGDERNLFPALTTLGLLGVSLQYALLIKRTRWLVLGGVQAVCVMLSTLWRSIESGTANQAAWTIQLGLMCLAIGLTITTAKSGRTRRYVKTKKWLEGYQHRW